MHLSRLNIGEMLSLSQPFLDPTHAAHQALASRSEVASLMPRLQEVHQALLTGVSADDKRADSLQKEVVALDAEHDDLVSGLDGLFQSVRFLIDDEEERLRWEQLHQLVLPEGRKMANMSYQEEASHAALLEHILAELPEADRNILQAQRVGNRTVYAIIERWIVVGKTLGQKERERLAVPAAPSDDSLREAQQQWARIVGAISAMLQMALILGELPAAVKQHVLAPLRAATDRKSSRPIRPPASAAPSSPSADPSSST